YPGVVDCGTLGSMIWTMINDHGSELETLEFSAALPDTRRSVQCRPFAFEFYCQRNKEEKWGKQDKYQKRKPEVEHPFYSLVCNAVQCYFADTYQRKSSKH